MGRARGPRPIVSSTAESEWRPVDEPRNDPALLLHANQGVIVVGTIVATELDSGSPAITGIERETTCRSEIPGDLGHLLRMAFNTARGLRGQRLSHIAGIASFIAMLARRLLVPPQVHLVSQRRLPCQSQTCVLPGAVVKGLMTVVGIIVPLRHIACILVAPQRDIFPVPLVAGSPVKPEPVFLDRTTEGTIHIPEFLQLVGSAQTGSLQRFRVIAALQRSTGSVRKEGAVEFIAADLRHDIHDRAAGCRFSHAAQDRKVDLLGGPDVRNIKRDAHSLIAHAQALHMDLAFVAASGVSLKDTEDGSLNATHVIALHIE